MPRSPFLIVAIDGGAASGKSSTSRTLSERFHFLHADTGSYYRALTAELLRRGVTPTDLQGVKTALAAVAQGADKENGVPAPLQRGTVSAPQSANPASLRRVGPPSGGAKKKKSRESRALAGEQSTHTGSRARGICA